MTRQHIEQRIYEKYGDKNYELLEFSTARERVKIKCLDCGEIFTLEHLSNLFIKGKKHFCVNCAGTKRSTDFCGKMMNYEIAQKKLDDFCGGEYVILEDSYKGWSKKALIRHTLCGKIFSIQPRYLLLEKRCPCLRKTFKGEERIKKFLEENKIEYILQKRLGSMKEAPFDFFLPNFNLLIEFQGKQHFEPVKQFGGKVAFEKQKEIDERKKSLAAAEGFELFYISYKEMSLIEELLVQRLSLTGSRVEAVCPKC